MFVRNWTILSSRVGRGQPSSRTRKLPWAHKQWMSTPSKKFAAARLAKPILEEMRSSEKLTTVKNTSAFPQLDKIANMILATLKITTIDRLYDFMMKRSWIISSLCEEFPQTPLEFAIWKSVNLEKSISAEAFSSNNQQSMRLMSGELYWKNWLRFCIRIKISFCFFFRRELSVIFQGIVFVFSEFCRFTQA